MRRNSAFLPCDSSTLFIPATGRLKHLLQVEAVDLPNPVMWEQAQTDSLLSHCCSLLSHCCSLLSHSTLSCPYPKDIPQYWYVSHAPEIHPKDSGGAMKRQAFPALNAAPFFHATATLRGSACFPALNTAASSGSECRRRRGAAAGGAHCPST